MLSKFLRTILLMIMLSLLNFLLFITSITTVSAIQVVPNYVETEDILSKLNPDNQLHGGSICSNKVNAKQQIKAFTDQNIIVTPAPAGTNDYATSPDPDYPERDVINAEGQTLHVPEGKIAYVSNAKQFMHAIYGGYDAGRAGATGDAQIPYQRATGDLDNYDTDITKIVFTKDIDLTKFKSDPDIFVYDNSSGKKVPVTFSDSGTFADNPNNSNSTTGTDPGEAYWNLTIKRRPSQEVINKKDYSRLVIDGQNHSIELGKFSLRTRSANNGNFNGRINQDLVAENMNIFGNSWYGIFLTAESTNETIQTFDNDNYYGSQMAFTNGLVQTYIKDHVNIYSLKKYKGLDDRIYQCQGGGNQQNFQTNNITFESDCVYKGYTYNANVVELTGGATLNDGAEVNLYPHGNSAEDQGILNEGILMDGSKGDPSLKLNGSAKLNIDCNTENLHDLIQSISADDKTSDNADNYSAPCGAFEMKGNNSTISFSKNKNGDSPGVNITSEGAMYGNNPLVYLQGGIANLSHGKFSVNAKELGKYNTANNGGLLKFDSTMKITVQSGGDFNVNVADTDNDPDSPINLIYANALSISIMNPKSINLDLRKDNCPNSALVYINNNSPQIIHAYDTRISASGNSKSVSGSNISGTLGQTNGDGKDVSLGIEAPLRVQTLELPFQYSAITANKYLDNTATIQAPKATLNELKNDMAEMNGKEFRYVHLSDLPGPIISSVPRRSGPMTRKITGTVTGDKWQNANDITSPLGKEFDPQPPLISVKVQHHNASNEETTATDLGTVFNNKEAQQKKNSDINNDDTVPVSPNRLKSSSLDVDEENIGQPIFISDDHPKYLDASDGVITWNKTDKSFSYNLDNLLANYNKGRTEADKLYLKHTDTIKTSAVTNFQETPIQNTRISNLDLQAGDEPSKPFLLGETIDMPFRYVDTDNGATKLTLKGNIYKKLTDKNGNTTKQLVEPFEETFNNIKHSTEWTNLQLQLPAAATENSGDYVAEFNGSDDQGNVFSIDDNEGNLSWKYMVSDFPKYNGEKLINDHRNNSGDENYPNIVGNLQYTLKTVFKIANSDETKTLSNVKFAHPEEIDGIVNSDQNIKDLSGDTLTASYVDDQGKTQSKQLKGDFNYDTSYKPSNFGLGNEFPAGVTFTITHKIMVDKLAPNDKVHIGADQMLSKDNKGEDILLGTSNSIDYNSIGSIVLNVKGELNYGNHYLPFNGKTLLIKKNSNIAVSIENNTNALQPINLTAQVEDNDYNNPLDNWLIYKDSNGDDHSMNNGGAIAYNGDIRSNVTQNISSNWFDITGKQKSGPILKLPDTNLNPGKYNTTITWNLTNSLH